MSKTKKIILIVFGVILLGIIVFWYLNKQTTIGITPNNGGFSVKNFFPFGNGEEAPINELEDSQPKNNIQNIQNSTSTSTTVPIAKLRKLSDRPVSGAVIFNKATTSVVRFVERATGNVYEARSDSNTVSRLTNETIPKISRVIWLKDGSGFLAQRLDDNETILTSFIKLKTATSTRNGIPFETIVSNLPTNIKEISVSPDSKKIFYYINSDKASGFTSNPDGTNPILVFSNYLTEWVPEWFSNNNISLSTKASSELYSYNFILNSSNKTLSKTYGDIPGISNIISNDGKNMVIGNGSTMLLFFKISDSSTSNTNIKTLPEKCTWDPNDNKFIYCGVPKNTISGNYPDDWYKGKISTNDLIQRINVFDNYTYILSDTKKDANVDIDISEIKSSKDGSFLVFTNKKDSSLWMFDTR